MLLYAVYLYLTDEDVDNEEVYKMAAVMSQCGGLRVMLKRYFTYCCTVVCFRKNFYAEFCFIYFRLDLQIITLLLDPFICNLRQLDSSAASGLLRSHEWCYHTQMRAACGWS